VQLDPLVPVRVGERFANLRPQLRIKRRHAEVDPNFRTTA
jgi:hypothetical protein